MSGTLPLNDIVDLREGLRRCSAATIDAAILYRQSRESNLVPRIVFGILQRYLPSGANVDVQSAPPGTRLMEDLGLDSLTMLEVVLSIEEVLRIRIENEELKSIRTLGHLHDFIHHKVGASPGVPGAKRFTRDEIMVALPQQPPFLFLDDAVVNDDVVRARYSIRGDEFFLEGHFRGNPVFPASIVFEALGQAACLWMVERVPAHIGRPINTSEILFASMGRAHFYRKAGPGDCLEFEQKLARLRDPLAVFDGAAKLGGDTIAKVDRLVLAFSHVHAPAGNGSGNGTAAHAH